MPLRIFCRRVSLDQCIKPEKFGRRRLEKRFGKTRTDVVKSIEQRENGIADSEFWRLRTRILDLSLPLSGHS